MPVYFGSLKESSKNRLSQIQYRAAKIVTGALHWSSTIKLNIDLGWETLQKRFEFLSLTLFHKIHCFQTRPLLRQCMPEQNNSDRYNTRNKMPYKPFPYHNKNFNSSFFPFFTKKYFNLNKSIRCQRNLDDFKTNLKVLIKPERHKYFNYGSKRGCSLATQFWVGCTKLNGHSYSIGLNNQQLVTA